MDTKVPKILRIGPRPSEADILFNSNSLNSQILSSASPKVGSSNDTDNAIQLLIEIQQKLLMLDKKAIISVFNNIEWPANIDFIPKYIAYNIYLLSFNKKAQAVDLYNIIIKDKSKYKIGETKLNTLMTDIKLKETTLDKESKDILDHIKITKSLLPFQSSELVLKNVGLTETTTLDSLINNLQINLEFINKEAYKYFITWLITSGFDEIFKDDIFKQDDINKLNELLLVKINQRLLIEYPIITCVAQIVQAQEQAQAQAQEQAQAQAQAQEQAQAQAQAQAQERAREEMVGLVDHIIRQQIEKQFEREEMEGLVDYIIGQQIAKQYKQIRELEQTQHRAQIQELTIQILKSEYNNIYNWIFLGILVFFNMIQLIFICYYM